MAQYFTDFSEYTTGEQPSDWTKRIATNLAWTVQASASAVGGKALRTPGGGSNARSVLSWDHIDADANRADVEVYFRCRFENAVTAAPDAFAAVRGSGTSSGTANFYRMGPRPNGGGSTNLQIARYLDGGFSGVGETNDFVYESNVFYNVLAQARGSAFKIRIWPDGDVEPAGWNIEVTNADIPAAGWVGLFVFSPLPSEFDVYGVGTGTDSAPRQSTAAPDPTPDPTPDPAPTLSNAAGSANGTTGYEGSVSTTSSTGTLYHVVSTDLTTPTVAQIKAGQDVNGVAGAAAGNQAVSAVGVQSVSGTGLTEGVTYYIHYGHENATGDSNPTTSGSFATEVSAPEPDPAPDPAVATPVNLSVSNITSTSATLNWEAGT